MKFDKEIKGEDVKYMSDYFLGTHLTSKHKQRGTIEVNLEYRKIPEKSLGQYKSEVMHSLY
jgi:hypothetical protein